MILNSKIFISKSQINENENTVHLINPIVDLQVPFLPTTTTFFVYAAIVVSPVQNNYDAKIEIVDEKGFKVISLSGPLNSPMSTERGFLQMHINANDVIIKNPGKHTCELYINENLEASYDFEVYNNNILLE